MIIKWCNLLLLFIILNCFIDNVITNAIINVKEKIENDEIDKLLKISKLPSEGIRIIYPSGQQVQLGNELTPIGVKDEPEIDWHANPERFYLLVMVDPDAPRRDDPKFSQVKHWLVGNIRGCNLSTGTIIADYSGAGPPKNTGLHRYIFLIYEQKEQLNFDNELRSMKNSRANRFHFSISQFAEKYNLGNPIAGNYFTAQWDPYVEERNKFITN